MLSVMKDKINLYLDFDETITLSIKQFVNLANKMFNVKQDWTKTKSWNFTDIYPNITTEDINKIFCSDSFFENLEMHKDVLEVLNKIKDYVNINIITIGTEHNLKNKRWWLENNIKPLKFNFIGLLDNEEIKSYNKSQIDMSNSIFIDDKLSNLSSSNAKIKILYKDYRDYSWQLVEPNQDIYIVNSWKEICEIILFFINNKENFI